MAVTEWNKIVLKMAVLVPYLVVLLKKTLQRRSSSQAVHSIILASFYSFLLVYEAAAVGNYIIIYLRRCITTIMSQNV